MHIRHSSAEHLDEKRMELYYSSKQRPAAQGRLRKAEKEGSSSSYYATISSLYLALPDLVPTYRSIDKKVWSIAAEKNGRGLDASISQKVVLSFPKAASSQPHPSPPLETLQQPFASSTQSSAYTIILVMSSVAWAFFKRELTSRLINFDSPILLARAGSSSAPSFDMASTHPDYYNHNDLPQDHHARWTCSRHGLLRRSYPRRSGLSRPASSSCFSC